MSEEELRNEEYFPRHIVVRIKHEEGQSSSSEWQGMVNEIKKGCDKSIKRINASLMHELESVKSMNERIQDDIQQLKTKSEEVESHYVTLKR